MTTAAREARASDAEVAREFDELVNMTPHAIEGWLDGDASREVGQKRDGRGESTGHASGRHIVAILRKKKSERTAADITHMRKVVGFIKRHLAQRPSGDVADSRWAASLKNWGHDPTRAAS